MDFDECLCEPVAFERFNDVSARHRGVHDALERPISHEKLAGTRHENDRF